MTGLLVATIQVSAILTIALGVVWLLRKRTASLRHAVLVIALVCAGIVPALGAYMPSWPRAFVPTFVETRGVTISRDLASSTALPGAVAIAPAGRAPPSPTPRFHAWQNGLPAIADMIRAVYIAGVVLSLAVLSLGLLRLYWIAARAEPMPSSRWQRRATAIAIAFRLRRTIHLARCSHPVLATWGFARPQVLLPAGAEDWPENRIRAVLLHELAHVRRNDWAIQVLAGVLRAVYWFNPLVWMVFARLRQESEQACDDAAIQQGEDRVEYAGHLLTLARSFSGMQATAALSMARPSTLTRRIAVVLDPATPHAATTRTSVTIAWAAMLTITCAIAACDGARRPGDDNSMRASSEPEVASDLGGNFSAEASSALPAAVSPGSATQTSVVDTAANAVDATAAPADEPAFRAPARDSTLLPERSPQAITTDILELVESALADESLAALDDIARPITGLHHIQRFAQTVVDADGGNAANPASNYAEIINALTNTANFASNVTSTPRGAQLPRQKVEQLATAMRRKAAELSSAVMPTPRVASINVSTPERRIAISALDLAQTTLRDTSFVGPPSNSWLANEILTLERAAQSVLSDDGANPESFATKLLVMRGALWSATRSAGNVSQRPRAAADVRNRAAELLASIHRIMTQLDAAIAGVD